MYHCTRLGQLATGYVLNKFSILFLLSGCTTSVEGYSLRLLVGWLAASWLVHQHRTSVLKASPPPSLHPTHFLWGSLCVWPVLRAGATGLQ